MEEEDGGKEEVEDGNDEVELPDDEDGNSELEEKDEMDDELKYCALVKAADNKEVNNKRVATILRTIGIQFLSSLASDIMLIG